MKLECLIFLEFFSYVFSFTFVDSQQPGVIFGVKSSSGVQQIFADENNVNSDGSMERVKIVLITEVEAEITVSGNTYPNQFDVKIIDGNKGSEKYVEVNRVDFEMLNAAGQTIFPIDIIANNNIGTKQTISLAINNLDDESPIFIPNNNCIMDENTKYLIDDVSNHPCSFEVQDPDGFLSGMNFTVIKGNKGESGLFELQYKETPKDNVTKSDVYLVLKNNQTLDYEKNILYVFHVQAKDGAEHPTKPVSSVQLIVQVNDQPDQTPVWDSYFKSYITINGKTETTLNVSAIDGDYGINNEINYSIKEIEGEGFVKIDNKTGVITIGKINKDQGQVVFDVTAFEVLDPNSFITNRVTVTVEGKTSGAVTLQRCLELLIISLTTIFVLT